MPSSYITKHLDEDAQTGEVRNLNNTGEGGTNTRRCADTVALDSDGRIFIVKRARGNRSVESRLVLEWRRVSEGKRAGKDDGGSYRRGGAKGTMRGRWLSLFP